MVPGDVLRVERTATGDVAFFRNGKPHGPGFTDADGNGCHGDVKLCVEMGEAGQQVQLQYDACTREEQSGRHMPLCVMHSVIVLSLIFIIRYTIISHPNTTIVTFVGLVVRRIRAKFEAALRRACQE